jgi:hypothetical protein
VERDGKNGKNGKSRDLLRRAIKSHAAPFVASFAFFVFHFVFSFGQCTNRVVFQRNGTGQKLEGFNAH